MVVRENSSNQIEMIEAILVDAFSYGPEQFVNHFEFLVYVGIVAMFVAAVGQAIAELA